MAAMVSHDILVPTDFGPGSLLALERAMRSLGPEGGTICVLHVLDQHLIAQMQALVPDFDETQLRARLRQQAETHYANLVAGLAQDNVTLEPLIIEGTPFLKIVQLARDFAVDYDRHDGAPWCATHRAVFVWEYGGARPPSGPLCRPDCA
jgi:nucleotide-binding universal stress UspA family protein